MFANREIGTWIWEEGETNGGNGIEEMIGRCLLNFKSRYEGDGCCQFLRRAGNTSLGQEVASTKSYNASNNENTCDRTPHLRFFLPCKV